VKDEGDESASVARRVERQVLVDEVDPVGESRELGRKLLQRGKAF
jgi:hypothetical protein